MWLYCLTPEAEYVPDWIKLFLAACADALRRKGDMSARIVTFGGMITLIARYMGMDLSSLKPSTLPFYYDMLTLPTSD